MSPHRTVKTHMMWMPFSHSVVSNSVTPWTAGLQAPLSLEFSRQEYWSGLPFPSPGYLPNPGSESSFPVSPALKVDSLPTEPMGKPTRYLESLVAQRVKRLPAMQETRVRSLGREDPLEKEMATHSSILAWRIPWTEEPGGLQSTGSQRVGHDFTFTLLTLGFEIRVTASGL